MNNLISMHFVFVMNPVFFPSEMVPVTELRKKIASGTNIYMHSLGGLFPSRFIFMLKIDF